MSQTDKTPEIAAGNESAGHAEFDSRGNSVWRWNSSTGADSTSIVLKRLDNDALQLEPTRTVAVPARRNPGDAPAPQRSPSGDSRSGGDELSLQNTRRVDVGGGFDPYDKS